MDSVRRAGEQVLIALLWVTVYPLLVLVTAWLNWRERMGERAQPMVDPLWPGLLMLAIVGILVCWPVAMDLISHV